MLPTYTLLEKNNILSKNKTKYRDPLLRPTFSLVNRMRRFIWHLAYFLLFTWTPVPLHFWRCVVLRCFGAKIGKSNFIYPNVKIWAPWFLTTEDFVTLGPSCEVYNPGGIYLGHHTIISQNAYLCGATHDYNSQDFTYVKREIRTEPYTWICSRAIVLPGVVCGEGSVLGAGAVTSRALKAWTVYAGNPARELRERMRANCKAHR